MTDPIDRKALKELARITFPNAVQALQAHNALPALLEANERLEGELAEARKAYRCFHCGFETTDAKEAAGHFGDRDDMAPLCLDWSELDADGRASEYQNVCGSLNSEREENCNLRTKIEGLEYQVEGQRSEIHSFKPFRECDTIQQVFNVYDSMEGRALAAEKQRDQAREQRDSCELEREEWKRACIHHAQQRDALAKLLRRAVLQLTGTPKLCAEIQSALAAIKPREDKS